MLRAALIAVSIAALAGCAPLPPAVADEHSSTLISSSYRAVDQLVATQSQQVFEPGKRVLVATVVKLNKLNESSPFGRLLAEHASSRLVQLGGDLTEVKLRGTLYVSDRQGEMLLSRELREISDSHRVDVLLVGTYTETYDRAFVTMKLIRAQTGQIVSAYNYSLQKNSVVTDLMRD